MSEENLSFYNFKKLEISPACGKKIARIQSIFERLAPGIMKMCRENKESAQGLIRLQEACVWFCRSVAIMSAYDIERKKKSIQEAGEIQEEENDNIGNTDQVSIKSTLKNTHKKTHAHQAKKLKLQSVPEIKPIIKIKRNKLKDSK